MWTLIMEKIFTLYVQMQSGNTIISLGDMRGIWPGRIFALPTETAVRARPGRKDKSDRGHSAQ